MRDAHPKKFRLAVAAAFALLGVFLLLFAPMSRPVEPQSQRQNPSSGLGSFPGGPPGAPGQNGVQSGPPLVPELPDINSHLNQRQKDALLKSNFQSTQRDIDKLNRLVQALQQEIKKSNAQVLSLKFVDQAGKIEKLAHRIRNELKAY